MNSENVSEIIESHHCFSEVSTYHIVSEDRPVGRPSAFEGFRPALMWTFMASK